MLKRVSLLWICVLILECLVVVAFSSEQVSVTVDSQMNIYYSGRKRLPNESDGRLPAKVGVIGDVVTFPNVGGTMSFWDAHDVAVGPDGGTFFPSTNVSFLGPLSSISHPRSGFLVGVFVRDDAAQTREAPTPYTYLKGDAEYQDRLVPQLDQVFYVGDGRGQKGQLQVFAIPYGATSLYLGIADAGSFNGTAGAYADNSGKYVVSARFERAEKWLTLHFIRKTDSGTVEINEISYNEPFYIKVEYNSEPKEKKKTVMLNWSEGPGKPIIVVKQPRGKDKKIIFLSDAIYAKRPE